jgi:hypothetical protein
MVVYLPALPIVKEVRKLIKVGPVGGFREDDVIDILRVTICGSCCRAIAASNNWGPGNRHFPRYVFPEAWRAK